MQKNLIVCMTPLQAMIAEKIIGNSKEKFDIIYIADLTDKNKNYFLRLLNICNEGIFIEHPKNLIEFLKFKVKIIKIRNFKYKSVYAANIDRKIIQYLYSLNLKANIYTFDDGVGNIIPKSSFNIEEDISIGKKIFWRLLGVKVNSYFIKEHSKTHYTIFNNIKNIIDKVEYVQLVPNLYIEDNEEKDSIKIFLGQPMTEINDKYNNIFISNLLEKFQINLYFPHPREKDVKLNIDIIESPKVFEEYVIDLMRDSQCKVEIYSFLSTAIINISQINNIEVKYICDYYLMEKYKEFYKIAQDYFNIKVINFENELNEVG
ncbi:glycosyltransferase family 52 [Acinetobacter baumannii]|uniref:glycosyltransferase family 52 n=1 Tax=Acinetobacter baumannii TaxID=470 RepID=UPI0006689836|nr:glycosyltransferase family 52 [Acinetobacter baumannii]MDH2482521.1 glycosyltransferase family 52 [Acinetobacter baumannii]MDH2503585.1 glycosyltransferase family 52 [Acinetobacter baumannii]MDN8229306.1 glycosyltransferase family 52 [Acinetobacter baumannii]